MYWPLELGLNTLLVGEPGAVLCLLGVVPQDTLLDLAGHVASLGEDRQVADDLIPVEGMDQAPVSPQGLGYPPPDLLVVVDPVVPSALDVDHHQALLIPHLEIHLGLVAVQEDPGHMVEMMDFVKINSGEAAADALVDQVVKNFDREKLI